MPIPVEGGVQQRFSGLHGHTVKSNPRLNALNRFAHVIISADGDSTG
jgi:hypothetical protein